MTDKTITIYRCDHAETWFGEVESSGDYDEIHSYAHEDPEQIDGTCESLEIAEISAQEIKEQIDLENKFTTA